MKLEVGKYYICQCFENAAKVIGYPSIHLTALREIPDPAQPPQSPRTLASVVAQLTPEQLVEVEIGYRLAKDQEAQSKDAEDARRWRFCLKYNFPSNTPIEELDDAIAAEAKL